MLTDDSENIFYSLITHGLFPNELKGGCKGTRATNDLIYVDQHILKESKKKTKK